MEDEVECIVNANWFTHLRSQFWLVYTYFLIHGQCSVYRYQYDDIIVLPVSPQAIKWQVNKLEAKDRKHAAVLLV